MIKALIALALIVVQSPNHTWEAQKSGVTARLRGVSAVSARVVWASGANGTLLRTTNGGETWTKLAAPADALTLDFRDIDAFSDQVAYALTIGAGTTSRIYKTSDGGRQWDLQFANTDPKVFLDAMTFWDVEHGIAFSDSVDDRFVILRTSNAGKTWERVPQDALPPALPGEGAFAASGTNVAMSGRNHVWIGTTASRVLHSSDGGRKWTIAQTPIDTGNATGIFSIAFRDAQQGVVVGGNYSQESQTGNNAAYTSDGGATWTRSKAPIAFRSVVAWAPGTQSLMAVGPAGADWSSDAGQSWTTVPIDEAAGAGFDTFSFAPPGRGTPAVGWATGSGGRIARVMPARQDHR